MGQLDPALSTKTSLKPRNKALVKAATSMVRARNFASAPGSVWQRFHELGAPNLLLLEHSGSFQGKVYAPMFMLSLSLCLLSLPLSSFR